MKDLEQAVYDTFSRALLAGTLTPGTPLRETALAGVFGVSRERIRKVLQRLGANRLIQLVPNRGAFVAAPSLEQAREIYEARRILESGIVSHLALNLSSRAESEVRAHMNDEAQALARGDRAESVRLSAQFHLMLAKLTQNAFIIQQMHELVSHTSMMVALHESADASRCSCDEHREIFSSLINRDAAGAARAMGAHLSLVETRLRPGKFPQGTDPVLVLGQLWAMRDQAAGAAPKA